jgi:hypothetical protein
MRQSGSERATINTRNQFYYVLLFCTKQNLPFTTGVPVV